MSAIPTTQHAVQIVGVDQIVVNPAKSVDAVGPTQLLLEVEACGICFSDTKLLHAFESHPRKSDIVSGLTPEQQQVVDQVIDFMNPVEPRFAGVELDNRAAMPDARIAGIRAPTLVVHATDDTLQLYRNAEFAAGHIPGARLLRFERGGHLLIAVEQPRIRDEIQAFIRSHAGP